MEVILLLVGACFSYAINKGFTKLDRYAGLAYNSDQHSRNLHDRLTRLKPLVKFLVASEQHPAVRKWLQRMVDQLNSGLKVLKDRSKESLWGRLTSSKDVLKVMAEIDKLVGEAGLVLAVAMTAGPEAAWHGARKTSSISSTPSIPKSSFANSEDGRSTMWAPSFMWESSIPKSSFALDSKNSGSTMWAPSFPVESSSSFSMWESKSSFALDSKNSGSTMWAPSFPVESSRSFSMWESSIPKSSFALNSEDGRSTMWAPSFPVESSRSFSSTMPAPWLDSMEPVNLTTDFASCFFQTSHRSIDSASSTPSSSATSMESQRSTDPAGSSSSGSSARDTTSTISARSVGSMGSHRSTDSSATTRASTTVSSSTLYPPINRKSSSWTDRFQN